jgi:RNA polymerase sigma-70 factor (ECF subfamily)
VPALLTTVPDDRAGHQRALNSARTSTLSDAELMERIRRGDEAALAALYDR